MPSTWNMRQTLLLVTASWVCGVLLLLGFEICKRHWPDSSTRPPPGRVEISINGSRGTWEARYPGNDGLLMTEDDVYTQGELRLPEQTEISCSITSQDYIYALMIDETSQQVAVPGMTRALTFSTGDASRRKLPTLPFCGLPLGPHEDMGTLVILPWEEVRDLFGARDDATR